MERPKAIDEARKNVTGRRDTRRRILVAVALVVGLGVAGVVATPWIGRLGGPDGPADPGAPNGSTWELEYRLGEVARIEHGAVARINGISHDVTLPPGQPGPEPGTRLVRVDAEVCAGDEEFFVDAAFWVGLGDDHAVHSAHMGIRRFQTMTLAPGACQRGDIDLALPEGVEVAGVLLMEMDHGSETAASWSVDGQPAGDEPLRSGEEPDRSPVGTTVSLRSSGSATLHEITPAGEAAGDQRLVRARVEVCAEDLGLDTGPLNWFVQLADHRLVRAQRDGATVEQAGLQPGQCAQGTVDFAVPGDAQVVAVVYTFGGVYEEARWQLDG